MSETPTTPRAVDREWLAFELDRITHTIVDPLERLVDDARDLPVPHAAVFKSIDTLLVDVHCILDIARGIAEGKQPPLTREEDDVRYVLGIALRGTGERGIDEVDTAAFRRTMRYLLRPEAGRDFDQ